MRDELGLFDDDSEDALIENYVDHAQARVAAFLGAGVVEESVVDRFTTWGDRRLELSGGWLEGDPVVTYFDEDRASQTLDAARYFVDETGGAWWWCSSSPARRCQRCTTRRSRSSGSLLANNRRAQDAAKQALQYLVSVSYEHRGTAAMPRDFEDYLARMLHPFRVARNIVSTG